MKKIFLLFIFLYTVSFGLNFSVAPTKFELDLKKSTTNEVYIINNTAKPLRLDVYLETPEGYEKNNLDDKITIFPKVVSVKPGAKQTVRFKVKVDKDMPKGKYKSLLVFRERPSDIKSKSQNKSEGLSTSITFITEIAIGVTGWIGKKY